MLREWPPSDDEPAQRTDDLLVPVQPGHAGSSVQLPAGARPARGAVFIRRCRTSARLATSLAVRPTSYLSRIGK